MNLLLKLFIKGHVALYTLSGGKLGQRMRGNDVIILSTRGAKTGALRRVPVVPLVEGDKLYVIASLGGAPRHPAWYHNMKANPDVEVQRGPARWRAKARVLPEPERTQVWQRVVATLPGFSEYQQKTSRVIPVVELVKT